MQQEQFIGDILVRQGALSPESLAQALTVAQDKGASLRDVLAASHVVEEDTYVAAIAQELGLEVIKKIQTDEIPNELIELVPITFARTHELLPFSEREGVIDVAMANILDLSPLDDLRVLSGKECRPVAAAGNLIEDAINRVYERKDENALSEATEGQEVEELQDLIDMTDEAPVIRWVNNLFYEAVRDRASDIHIEPGESEVVVRYRIDGNLYPVKTAHKGFLSSIVARVKIEANLNIAEKRLPQDGRITKKIKGKVVDIRVSTVPTSRGERIVLRLLDKEQVLLDLPDLGFSEDKLSTMDALIRRPNGIILVTGPTGAGKTTTLYACLNKINTPDLNILTVEDPVEYELKGIGQVHVRPKIGLTFAAGLRAFLRQDPDVIMVGEIRDQETAEIAIHASLTGHLVFSTLHTNDAAGAVARLVEMEIQPFLIASSLLAVLAQRLVRRLCKHCAAPFIASDEDLHSIGLNPAHYGPPRGPASPNSPAGDAYNGLATPAMIAAGERPPRPIFHRPVGCEACSQTGYSGRVGIYELLVVDEPVRRALLASADSKSIARAAIERGMITLREDGARQVAAGRTSMEEVLAMTQAGDME